MKKLIVCGTLLLICSIAWAGEEQQPLSGAQIRDAVSGKTVRLSTPAGLMAVYYQPNGGMQGAAGKGGGGLAGEKAPRDVGRWGIYGDQLCLRWRKWLDGRTFCLRLRRAGDLVYWRSAEGYTGVARIIP